MPRLSGAGVADIGRLLSGSRIVFLLGRLFCPGLFASGTIGSVLFRSQLPGVGILRTPFLCPGGGEQRSGSRCPRRP